LPKAGDLSKALEAENCKCEFIELYSIKPKYIFKLSAEVRKIRDFVIKNEIDILHPDYMSDVYLANRARKGLNTKLLWHVRWTEKFPKRDKAYEKLVDGMVCVSSAASDRFSKTPEIKAKCRVVYNGVDCRVFKPADDKIETRKKLGLPVEGKILLFVGLLKKEKGVFDLLNGYIKFRQDNKDAKLSLVYIGSPVNDETQTELLNRIKNSGFSNDIHVFPQQTNIHEWMSAADMLAILSHEGNEGMPRVLYESFSCGVAGIGSDTSGINEAITPETGLLIPEQNIDSIAGAIGELNNNEEMIRRFQVNARQRALDYFDIRIHAAKVQDFYDYLLSKR
jgi:glycosyltransferase involved in cell wall biosynthesis